MLLSYIYFHVHQLLRLKSTYTLPSLLVVQCICVCIFSAHFVYFFSAFVYFLVHFFLMHLCIISAHLCIIAVHLCITPVHSPLSRTSLQSWLSQRVAFSGWEKEAMMSGLVRDTNTQIRKYGNTQIQIHKHKGIQWMRERGNDEWTREGRSW